MAFWPKNSTGPCIPYLTGFSLHPKEPLEVAKQRQHGATRNQMNTLLNCISSVLLANTSFGSVGKYGLGAAKAPTIVDVRFTIVPEIGIDMPAILQELVSSAGLP